MRGATANAHSNIRCCALSKYFKYPNKDNLEHIDGCSGNNAVTFVVVQCASCDVHSAVNRYLEYNGKCTQQHPLCSIPASIPNSQITMILNMAHSPAECSSCRRTFKLAFFPHMLLYQCTRPPNSLLSSIMARMKASSPPGHTISADVPPQAVLGFWLASWRDSKKGGLHMQK